MNRLVKSPAPLKLAVAVLHVLIASISVGCNENPKTSAHQHTITAAVATNHEASVDALFTNLNKQTPGISIAVIKDGETILKKGYGTANLEYGLPITGDTIFDIGSVSKQFTAFSIFLLEAQGKLSLDDDIRQYIPEVPDFGTPITIRHLCYHSSGLRDQWAMLTLAGWRMDDVITGEQTLNLISHQMELNFSPGDQFMYSNTGYFLLAEIVARVSDKSFRDFAQDEIFTPLGMSQTQVYDSYKRIVPERAYSYARSSFGYEKRNLNVSLSGPTSVMSSAHDLTKWVNNFQTPIVGTMDLTRRFNEVAKLNSGEDAILTVNAGGNVYAASGQFKWNFRGTPVYNHTGSTAGFESYLGRFPEKDFAVVALSNQENFNIFKTGIAIADIFIGNELESPLVIEKQFGNTESSRLEALDTLDHAGFTGAYTNAELSTTYDVIKEKNGLALKHKRHGILPLTFAGDDEFTGRIVFPVSLKFIRDTNGNIVSFDVSNFGIKAISFERE